jgi:predicted acetyltransferase
VAIEVRPVTPTELPAWFDAAASVFFMWPWGEGEAVAAVRAPHMDLARTLAAFDGSAIVGTYRTFATELTVPGGRQVRASALTAVTVRSTHRRQGVLSSLVGLDMAGAADRGDVLGVLLASEWPIYGRFGYGPASWGASWTVRTRATRFRTPPSGSIEILRPKAAREVLPEIYARYHAGQPGEIGRFPLGWDLELGLMETPGRPRWRGVVAVHRTDDGTPDGYALYHGEEKWDEGIPDNVLVLDELHGVTEAAEIELWRYLCSIDLVATVRADMRRAREPLIWYLEDARAAHVRGVNEELWLRLYDLPAALAARAYDRADRLVFEVVDRIGERNGPAAGRFELDAGPEGTTCRRSRRSADLTVDVGALGAAYLGGTPLQDTTRAGGASEATPGALRRADLLLRTTVEPWCSTHF